MKRSYSDIALKNYRRQIRKGKRWHSIKIELKGILRPSSIIHCQVFSYTKRDAVKRAIQETIKSFIKVCL